jgi:tight adherence protein B
VIWLLSVAFIFLTVVLVLISAYALMHDLWLYDQARLSERLNNEFRKPVREPASGPFFKDLARLATELAAEEGPQPAWRARLELWLDQSGLPLPIVRLLWLTGGLALASGAAAAVLNPSVGMVSAAVVLGAAAPWLFVGFMRQRRLDKLRSQIPEAFELIARALRSGRSLAQAVQGVADESTPPLAGEFAYCATQQSLGLAPEAAYQDLARRTGLPEFRMFAVTMLVQQRTGGNIAEPLEKLAGSVRERLRFRLKVKALTAESRLQAWALTALPALIFALLWTLKRQYVASLLKHPLLLVAIAVSQGIGILWIRAIVSNEN